MKDTVFYFKVIAGICVALLASHICIVVFFPTRSPLLRENIPQYLSQTSHTLLSQASNFIPQFSLPSLTLFNPTTTPEEVSTSYSSSSVSNSVVVLTPEKSIVAAGIRQNLSTQKLVSSTPGIYVTTNAASCLTVLRQNEVKWSEYNVNVGGETVKVRVPAGQQPPPEQVLK